MRDHSARAVPLTNNAQAAPPPPVIDDDGLLRYAGRWVAITDTQLPVVELLVRRFGSLVSNEDLLAAYGTAGGSASNTALRPLVYRLKRRVGVVGLTLHVVRRRGVLLEPDPVAQP